MKAPQVPPMPLDWAEYQVNAGHLTPRQHYAYQKLLAHYWLKGALLLGDVHLAAICGFQLRSFEAMRLPLLQLFEPDETGLWREHDLKKARTDLIDKQALRSEINRANARARQEGLDA